MRSFPSPVALSLTALALLVLSCAGSGTGGGSRNARDEAHVLPGGAIEVAANQGPLGEEEDAAVPISPRDPVWGSRRALVSVVVFGDFECPFTGRVLPTIVALEQKYGPTDLRVVWKDEPLDFHKSARPAAEAAETVLLLAGSDAYWKFWHEALTHQTELTTASFEAWATAAGVDLASYRHGLDAHLAAAKVDADRAVGERLRVTGTPTSFVNGVALLGAQPESAFTALVDAELVKAKARLAAGVAPDALYADLAKTNWKLPADDEGEGDEPKEDTTTVWNVPVRGSPARGPADALVTIVEFSDFQCPYCQRVEPALAKLRTTYGGKVRLVWKDSPLPFHKNARPAAELAREARAEKGDAGFWAAHDALFAAQTKLETADLEDLGKTLGLDPARVRKALDAKTHDPGITADLDLGDDVHVEGTPHFFINGRRLVGAQPVEKFQALVDEEIRHAEGLVASGTKSAVLYDTILQKAETPSLGERRAIVARAGAPFRGPAGAPVVIEEFADFQCPFCTRGEATLRQVVETYGSKVKVVWRNLPLPFHEHAALAAEAALEAQHQKGNAGFWAMHDTLFAHQADHDSDGSGLDRAALDGYARALGLDVAAFDAALDRRTRQAEVQADVDAAEAAHIQGTPAFLVAGVYVAGAQPFAKFRRIIDRALALPAGAVAKPRSPSLAH